MAAIGIIIIKDETKPSLESKLVVYIYIYNRYMYFKQQFEQCKKQHMYQKCNLSNEELRKNILKQGIVSNEP